MVSDETGGSKNIGGVDHLANLTLFYLVNFMEGSFWFSDMS